MRERKHPVKAVRAVARFKGFDNKLSLTVDAADRGNYPQLVPYPDVAVCPLVNVYFTRRYFFKRRGNFVVNVFQIFGKIGLYVVGMHVRARFYVRSGAGNRVAVLYNLFADGYIVQRKFMPFGNIFRKRDALVRFTLFQVRQGYGNVVAGIYYDCLFQSTLPLFAGAVTARNEAFQSRLHALCVHCP